MDYDDIKKSKNFLHFILKKKISIPGGMYEKEIYGTERKKILKKMMFFNPNSNVSWYKKYAKLYSIYEVTNPKKRFLYGEVIRFDGQRLEKAEKKEKKQILAEAILDGCFPDFYSIKRWYCKKRGITFLILTEKGMKAEVRKWSIYDTNLKKITKNKKELLFLFFLLQDKICQRNHLASIYSWDYPYNNESLVNKTSFYFIRNDFFETIKKWDVFQNGKHMSGSLKKMILVYFLLQGYYPFSFRNVWEDNSTEAKIEVYTGLQDRVRFAYLDFRNKVKFIDAIKGYLMLFLSKPLILLGKIGIYFEREGKKKLKKN